MKWEIAKTKEELQKAVLEKTKHEKILNYKYREYSAHPKKWVDFDTMSFPVIYQLIFEDDVDVGHGCNYTSWYYLKYKDKKKIEKFIKLIEGND